LRKGSIPGRERTARRLARQWFTNRPGTRRGAGHAPPRVSEHGNEGNFQGSGAKAAENDDQSTFLATSPTQGSNTGGNHEICVEIADNTFNRRNQPDLKKDHQRDWTMKTILASSTVLFTILFSLAFGIACGYAVISMILHAFAHKPAQKAAPATAVIATTASSH
jgi:hypothetical protein